jgi:ankyrin repeat protein
METNEPPTTEQIRDFIVAAHGNLPRIREMLLKNPELLNARYQWADNDSETAIEAAAQVGSTQVADYLLRKGAPLNICTAAMLGRVNDVKGLLEQNPELIHARGAHGIPIIPHAAHSGNLELVKMLFDLGARAGMSHALGNAMKHGDSKMARWIIENGGPDLEWKNYEGKNLLTIARETGKKEMLDLLQGYGIA